MTALQHWLSSNPVDPRNIKDAICDAWRELTAASRAGDAKQPQLMGRGLERC